MHEGLTHGSSGRAAHPRDDAHPPRIGYWSNDDELALGSSEHRCIRGDVDHLVLLDLEAAA
jgi:hypothetical protein